jgi:hypothetical protein
MMKRRFLGLACAAFFLATLSFSATRYVSPAGNNAPPYTNWTMAATNIQLAIGASADGDVVLVTNGTYDTGGVAVYGGMTNRVAITNGIVVQSVNGAGVTTIVGQGPVGVGAVRCAWIASNAVLDGFTLTNGHTLAEGDAVRETCGGGAWLEYNGATLSNCVITTCAAANMGGGFYHGRIVNSIISNNAALFGGGGEGSTVDPVDHCVFADNRSVRDGGGLYSGATARNSYFAGNTAGERGGGLYGVWNVESCTIAGNAAQEGGGVHSSSVSNSVVYHNTDRFGSPNHKDCFITYSCTTPDPGATGNLTNSPGLAGLRNPHLVTNSPCIDAGTNSAWMIAAVDVDGEPRLGGSVDLGCDEVVPTGMVASLFVSIGIDRTNAVVGTPIRFNIENINRPTKFTWAWGDGSGTTNETVATHAYAAAGDYVVTVQAWNRFGFVTVTSGVHIFDGFTNYVSGAGSATPPYDTWGKAAARIQDAVDLCAKGGTVLVSNGVYALGGAERIGSNRVAITNAMIVRSVNGPTQTVVRGVASTGLDAMRGAYVCDGAQLIGFSLTDGRSRGSSVPIGNIGETLGGGVFAEAGARVANCMITNNGALNGGGACGWGAFENCTLADNSSAFSGGGALYGNFRNCSIGPDNESHFGAGVSQAVVDSCDIHDNRASEIGGGAQDSTIRRSIVQDNTSAGSAGGAYVSTLENCLILFNTANGGDGGGTHQGTVRHCVIRGNQASDEGGGAYEGVIAGSILYYNYASTNANVAVGSGSLNYSCTTPDPGTGVGNITNNPQFEAYDGVPPDFHLLATSPCIDTGDPLSAVTNDYDGGVRPVDGNLDGTNIVDMGAYEYVYHVNTYYRDADGDGYGNPGVTTNAISPPAGYVSDNTDWNDSNASVYPGAPELCDGVDNNGNGQIDENCRVAKTCFSLNQSIRCAGAGWSRTFVMDLTNFRNLAVQDGYQSYAVNYLLYYNIWTGIYLYDYTAGAFSAVTWAINLDL